MATLSFNPYRAGGAPVAPNVSFGDVQKLLAGSTQSVNDALGALTRIGQVKRSENVNDLIARGGLQGLNEADAQAKLLATAGGSITPEAQKTIDALLGRKSKETEVDVAADVASTKFGRDKLLQDIRLQSQEIMQDKSLTSTEKQNLLNRQLQRELLGTKQEFQAGESDKDRLFKTGMQEAQQKFTTGEREATQDFRAKESQKDREAQVELQTQRDEAALTRQGWAAEDAKKLAESNNQYKLLIAQANADKEQTKLNDRDKLAIKDITPGKLQSDIKEVFGADGILSEDMDYIWDRGLDDRTSALIEGIASKALSEKGNASRYMDFGAEGLKDIVLDYMKKNNLKFSDPVWNPFATRSLEDINK